MEYNPGFGNIPNAYMNNSEFSELKKCEALNYFFKRFQNKLVKAFTLLHSFDVGMMLELWRKADYKFA